MVGNSKSQQWSAFKISWKPVQILQQHGDLRSLHVFFTRNIINWKGRGLYVMNIVNIYITGYTGCPRRKGQNFGRVFLTLKYTDITQNTYIQSWTVTEIMNREKCGLLAGLRTVSCQLTAYRMSVPDCCVRLQKYRWRSYVSTPLWLTACHV